MNRILHRRHRLFRSLPVALLLSSAWLIWTGWIAPAPMRAQGGGLELVGQLGGPGGHAHAVAVGGSVLYVGQGMQLAAFDISDPDAPRRLSPGLVLPGSIEQVVLGDGIALVSTTARSVFVVDIADPARLQRSAEWPARWSVGGILIAGDRAFVSQDGALRVLDLADPRTPVELAVVPDVYSEPGGLSLSEDRLYVANYRDVRIFDVGDPAWPSQLTSFTPAVDSNSEGFLYLDVEADRLYVLGHDLHIFDVSDPARPRQIGRFIPWRWPGAVVARGDRVYLAQIRMAVDTLENDGGMQIVDVSDPSQPVTRGRVEILHDGRQLALQGDHAYLAAGGAGLLVVDLSDPDQPQASAVEPPPFAVADAVVAEGSAIFVADGEDLLAFDASESMDSQLLSRTRIEARWRGDPVVAGAGHLYAFADGRVQVLELGDPSRPQPVAEIEVGASVPQMAWQDDRLLLTTGERLGIFDVGQPQRPRLLAWLDLPENTIDLAVEGDLAYLSDFVVEPDDVRQSLTLVALDDPRQPMVTGQLRIPRLYQTDPFATDVSVVDGLAYIGGALLVDARDARRPRLALKLTEAGKHVETWRRGDRLYVAANGIGSEASCLRALDIRRPEAPRQLAGIELPAVGLGNAITMQGERIFVAAARGGVQIFRDTGRPEAGSGSPRCAPQSTFEPVRAYLPMVIGRR